MLEGAAPGTTARLSYVPLNRETPHEASITVEGVDDAANVFRFEFKMGPHPEQSFAAPLRDVENTWCPDGTHHLRLSGYMDHTPLEPYRYVSRGGMAWRAFTWCQYPAPGWWRRSGDYGAPGSRVREGRISDHKVWNFSFPIGNAVASELRALRMIETLGSRGRDTQAWRLTDAGQRWVMAHRVASLAGALKRRSPKGTEWRRKTMAKWADYVITRVRFNAAGTHIDEVEAADDGEDGIGTKRSEKRATVIAKLKAEERPTSRRRRRRRRPARSTKGAPVGVVVVNGTEYIRTDANKTARDNLDNLPTY